MKILFWRKLTQTNIDFKKARDGMIVAYEFKWLTAESKMKFPKSFKVAYNP
ncbi:MAG: hypothetical protein N2167_07295 [Flavobacteriales bacterium]|nr:hypothetical protein [Flavobacteriales bacterium]